MSTEKDSMLQVRLTQRQSDEGWILSLMSSQAPNAGSRMLPRQTYSKIRSGGNM